MVDQGRRRRGDSGRSICRSIPDRRTSLFARRGHAWNLEIDLDRVDPSGSSSWDRNLDGGIGHTRDKES